MNKHSRYSFTVLLPSHSRSIFSSGLILASAMLAGCGSKGTVVVEPKFTLDGQPLKKASVTFIRTNDGGGRAAIGVTDDQGIAHLTTYKPLDGVLPGEYRVVVLKGPENPNAFVIEELDLKDPKVQAMLATGVGMSNPPKQRKKRVRTLLPEVYSDPGSTPLECTVPFDGDELVFELNSEI